MVSTGSPLRRPRLNHLPRSGRNRNVKPTQASLPQENILEVKPVTSLMMICRSTGAEGNGSLTVEERKGDATVRDFHRVRLRLQTQSIRFARIGPRRITLIDPLFPPFPMRVRDDGSNPRTSYHDRTAHRREPEPACIVGRSTEALLRRLRDRWSLGWSIRAGCVSVSAD